MKFFRRNLRRGDALTLTHQLVQLMRRVIFPPQGCGSLLSVVNGVHSCIIQIVTIQQRAGNIGAGVGDDFYFAHGCQPPNNIFPYLLNHKAPRRTSVIFSSVQKILTFLQICLIFHAADSFAGTLSKMAQYALDCQNRHRKLCGILIYHPKIVSTLAHIVLMFTK